MTTRAIFFEEDDAVRVVARLASDGFAAELVRDRLHGEDDDEDQPWAVLTDAPAYLVELLVDQHDGWLESGAAVPLPPAPMDLPDAPRRIKNPDSA